VNDLATVVRSVEEMRLTAERVRMQNKRIGLVPTMGSLHKGHTSLIHMAKQRTDVVVTSIFVNPTQFGPSEDFTKYPRNLTLDIQLASDAGAEFIFAPETGEMYSADHLTSVQVERVTDVLEGKSRPGHFRGVATVVAKLLNITRPHVAFFGQKDAQQVVVIRRMVRDMDFGVELVVGPIIREADGLAMSSRNVYLSTAQRKQAVVLNESLKLAERAIHEGERNPSNVTKQMRELIEKQTEGIVDYISIADADTLEERTKCQGRLLISLAVCFGNTRLIDNTTLQV
jgi:pantoate--beta-alanine ligase